MTKPRSRAYLIGKKFNNLTIIQIDHVDEDNYYHLECTCACGNIVVVREDAVIKGRTKSCGCMRAKGERCHMHKLTENEVRQIKIASRNGKSVSELALNYNVSTGCIYKILNKLSWKHVV